MPQKLEAPLSEVIKTTTHLVYTGTISTIYGIKEAVYFAERLHEAGLPIQFSIMGKVAEPELQSFLQHKAQIHSWLQLTASEALVPHSEILTLLRQADFVLLPYQDNPSTRDCIPTRMYECLAMGIPMLVQQNPRWETMCLHYEAGISIDFNSTAVLPIWQKMMTTNYYPSGPIQNALWSAEERKLLSVISRILP